MEKNKVQFNFKNVYYAAITESVVGGKTTESFGTPVAIPGGVSVQIDPEGSTTPFYADGIKYYVSSTNAGYTGKMVVAKIPDQMLIDIWNFAKDSKGVISESVDAKTKDFALLFQIDGDQTEELYVFYKVTASRPSIASSTVTNEKDVQTQELSISCAPLATNGKVLSRTTEETDATTKSSWFTKVYA